MPSQTSPEHSIPAKKSKSNFGAWETTTNFSATNSESEILTGTQNGWNVFLIKVVLQEKIFFSSKHLVCNQSLFVVITTGFDIYYISFRFESGDFLLRRKMQFELILETFENSDLILKIQISTVKFSINEHHFSAWWRIIHSQKMAKQFSSFGFGCIKTF